MKASTFRHSLLLAALAALPASALFQPSPMRVPPGGPHPEDWFGHSTTAQREELVRLTSSRATRAQELINLLLQGDEDAYCELAVRSEENRRTIERLYPRSTPAQRAILAPLHAYHKLAVERSSFRDEKRYGEPRAHVVLLLRDAYCHEGQEARREALRRILAQEADLHRVELTYISAALRQWCGIPRDPLIEKRIVQSFILEYANGRPVVVDSEMQNNISYSYAYLYDFLLAEAGVANERYFRLRTSEELMWRFLWRYPAQAARMGEVLDAPQLALLAMDAPGLAGYVGSLARSGTQAPAALPPATAEERAATPATLARVRALLGEGRRGEAEKLVAAMEAEPTLDTTPACRMARSLLVAGGDPMLAARLRRDALLLALIRRDYEPGLLHAYVDDLLEHGDRDALALAQRVPLWCRALPDYARLARRYEELQCWEQAAFCHEALLALAPHTATPPAEETLAASRRQLAHCRGQAGRQQAVATTAPQPASPFRADMRDWKLKDGSSLRAALAAIYPTMGEILLRLEDGSQRRLALDSLAEKHDAYFEQWRADNGIRDWAWRQGVGCYRETLRGKLLAAYGDLQYPGDYYYTVVDENLSIARGQSWGLPAEERALVAGHFRAQGSARPFGEPLVAADLADARRLSAETGLPVILIFTDSLRATSCTNMTMDALENHLQLHPGDAASWRASMVILPIYLSTIKGYPAAYDEEELEALRAYERELHPDTAPTQSLISRAITDDWRKRSTPTWVCPAHKLLHHGALPPPLPTEQPQGKPAAGLPQEL